MSLTGKSIGFAYTGSFCTLDIAFDQMKRLVAMSADVYPIASFNASNIDTRFGSAADFMAKAEDICGKPVISSINKAEPIGPKKLLDVVIIAPCTGNTIAKLANAITDTPVLMAAKAHMRNGRAVVLAIATNDGLGFNARNIGQLLANRNIYFVPYGQDGPDNKEKSLQAKFGLIPDTIEKALEGRQLQPMILGAMECLET